MKHKVCFVGAEITPSEGSAFVGGHVNTVVGLCKGLTGLGWEVHIVTSPSRFLKSNDFSFPWAKFHLIHASGKYNSLYYDFDYVRKTVGVIKALHASEGIELVHSHSGYFAPAIIPALVRRSIDIPVLFSLYCPVSLLPHKLPIDRFGIKVLSYGLDKVIAVTENVKGSLIKCGVTNEQIKVLHSCFDEEAFRDLSPPKKESSSEGSKNRRVLFVGNADKTKGLDIFLKSAQSILVKKSDVKFVITLHEPQELIQSVRIAAFKLLGSSVEVLGVVHDMPRLMSSVDVVVVPFRSTEGISDIPVVVLEAMALGKPVVASNLDGVKEAVQHGETGIIVNLNSHELANAITNLLDHPSLGKKIGYNASLSVRKYSFSEISKQLSSLYLKVIEAS